MTVPLEDERLLIRKHKRYLERHLNILPSKFQEHEPNKLAIVTYALTGLSCIGEDLTSRYPESARWLKSHLRECTDGQDTFAGFVPSVSLDVSHISTLSLTSTLFGILSLICLDQTEVFKEESTRVKICRFVSRCQSPKTGRFASNLDVALPAVFKPSSTDPDDLRHTYVAIEILYLMGCRKPAEFSKFINLEGVLKHVQQQACYSGGFGQYGEPHAGYTSCALSILKLLDIKSDILPPRFYDKTKEWLMQRQVCGASTETFTQRHINYDPKDHGGFQGRENKYADACYSFWCVNSLKILGAWEEIGLDQQNDLMNYLLANTQNSLLGGFAKNDSEDPDLYHTSFVLAAISMMSDKFDGALFLPVELAQKFTGSF